MPELPSRLQSRIVFAGSTANVENKPTPAPLAFYAWEPHVRRPGARRSLTYKT